MPSLKRVLFVCETLMSQTYPIYTKQLDIPSPERDSHVATC